MPENFAAAAADRERDARLLLRHERWTGAIYMARFSFECVLKELLVRGRATRLPARFRTHDLWRLTKSLLAGPLPKWLIIQVKQINEVEVEIRYNVREFSRRDAERLCALIWSLKQWLRRQL
jgi:HEPN domain-containing protein